MTDERRAQLEEKLIALQDAIFDGVLEIKYSDKEVKFMSLRDMKRSYDMLKNELGLTSKVCRIKTNFSKGLDEC